jgi:hypothetical protein
MLGTSSSKSSIIPHVAKLSALIEQEITANPFQKDGLKWVNRPYDWYCKALGLSARSISGLLSKQPFERLVIMNAGKKVTLVREREPGEPMNITHCQRLLQKIWIEEIGPFNERKAKFDADMAEHYEINIKSISKEIGQCKIHTPGDKAKLAKLETELAENEVLMHRRLKKSAKAAEDAKMIWEPTPMQYGCLRGLVKAWGTTLAPDLFKMVIREWSEFMSATKIHICELEAKGEKVFFRFYELPSIPVILRFNAIVIDMKKMRLQNEFSKIIAMHIDHSLPTAEQQKLTGQLYKEMLDGLKPESFPDDAG